MSEDVKDYFSKAAITAYNQGYENGYKVGYNEGYEAACNDHIRPTDARNDGERTVITTEEVRAEIGRIKDCIDDLYDRVKRLESVVFYGGKAETRNHI